MTERAARLTDHTVLVTGGGRGIGRAMALRSAEAGADVVIAARSTDELEAVAEEIRDRGRRALVLPTDITDESSVRAMAEQTLEVFGQIDVLMANSGVGGPSAPLWDIPLEDWQGTFAVNVTGTYLCCRAVLPHMVARERGSIVITGSMTGKRPLINRSPYASSKMALVGLTRTLAAEAGPYGVRVNLISPGPVVGDRLEWVIQKQAEAMGSSYEAALRDFEADAPLQRLVDPDDVADAAVFLASNDAGAITGEDLNVTAGMVMY